MDDSDKALLVKVLKRLEQQINEYEDGFLGTKNGNMYNFSIGEITGYFEVDITSGICRPYQDFEVRWYWYNDSNLSLSHEFNSNNCRAYPEDYLDDLAVELAETLEKDFDISRPVKETGWFDGLE